MEFTPVIDPLDRPKEGIWYSLLPRGSSPGIRVGHTCMFFPSEETRKGKILIIGGTKPDGSFLDSSILNLDNHEWDITHWKGLKARYEHCSFVPESCPQSLWVFGGAKQNGNRNCIQKIQLTDGEPHWRDVTASGELPSPRTYHTSSACIGDKLFVFSGGEAGAAPVPDTKLHIFDTVSCKWSQPETQGRTPPPRQGHVVAAVSFRIYVHGGLAGDKFYKDMYRLDSRSMKWEKVPVKGDIPSGVAAHTSVVLGKKLFIFGGVTADGATNSMYRFNTENDRWTLMKFEGHVPPNRLDHSMCVIPWTACEESRDVEENNPAAVETFSLAFVFGGMDTQGTIYDDCFVTLLK